MPVNSLGLSGYDGTSTTGRNGRGIASVDFDDNNDGSVTVTYNMTDGSTEGPFTGTLTSDTLIAHSLTLEGSGTHLIVKDDSDNTIVSVNADTPVANFNTPVYVNNFLQAGYSVPGGFASAVLANLSTDSSSNIRLNFIAGNGSGSSTGNITYGSSGFTVSGTINSPTIASATINNATIANPTITQADITADTTIKFSGTDGTVAIGESNKNAGNVWARQIVLGPTDGDEAVFSSHRNPRQLTNCASMGVAGNIGLTVDENGNAEIYGEYFYKYGGGLMFENSSDSRLKENITDFTQGLNVISQIQVRNFNFIATPEKPQVGIIAQELQEIYPKAVKEGKDGYLTYDGSDIIFLLINAVKELKAEIANLNEEIYELQYGKF